MISGISNDHLPASAASAIPEGIYEMPNMHQDRYVQAYKSIGTLLSQVNNNDNAFSHEARYLHVSQYGPHNDKSSTHK